MTTSTPVSRLAGLDAASAQRAAFAAQAIDAGRVDEAAAALMPVVERYPEHPEVLRLHAGIANLYGDHDEAIAAMRIALRARPLDAPGHNTYGTLLAAAGLFDEAAAAFAEAGRLDPSLASAWYNLGVLRVRCMRNDEAIGPLQRALALEPGNIGARNQLADLLRTEGRAEEAESEYRAILASHPTTGMAWWGLADLKTGRLTGQDAQRLRALFGQPTLAPQDAVPMGFALARALDEQGAYADALAAIERANALARRRGSWDRDGFVQGIEAIGRAFAGPMQASPDAAAGANVIFVVGLPRSGSTLIEQILASHPQVEGAGELPDLPLVLSAEARRRGARLQDWAPLASATDWKRLGDEYIERTRRWTRDRPVFVDKLPSNWYYTGAIRAMLPAAKVVIARRDPLETCFSCYRQYLENNEYTRTYANLAAYWRAFDGHARRAVARDPGHVHDCVHELLVAEPEAAIRALLDACGLAFDPACLDFHRTRREVRSPSAMQVREPIRRDTTHAWRYGALLDPLRGELGVPRFAP